MPPKKKLVKLSTLEFRKHHPLTSVLRIKEHKLGFRRSQYRTVGIKYLKEHMKGCFKYLTLDREIVVEKNRRPVAVLINFHEYSRLVKQRHMMILDQIATTKYDYD